MKEQKKKLKTTKATKTTSRVEQKRNVVLDSLRGVGEQIYDQLSQKAWPSVRMPSRSISNIHYDEKTRQYVLGEHYVKRSARNIRHVRPLTQLVWTGSFVDELSREGKTSTLRDVFYSAQAYEMSFADQAESDDIITDLETVLGYPREDFNVFPEERSAIFGDLTIQYTVRGYEGKKLNLSSHPDGMMIGPALTNAEFADCKADKIIAIEKGGLFMRFIEERVHEKYKALLIHTAGQAPGHESFAEATKQGAGSASLHLLRRGPMGNAHRQRHHLRFSERCTSQRPQHARRQMGWSLGLRHS